MQRQRKNAHKILVGICCLYFGFAGLRIDAAETASAATHFLGAQSCSTSGCHGGAADRHNEFLAWLRLDFHSRAHATLTSSRSARMMEAIGLKNAVNENRCTSCHAPFETLKAASRSPALRPSEGVSCESCHGPASDYLRPHSRTDYTYKDRVHAGLRDLRDLYVRANTCVACHQNVERDILSAGHPELIFELDGQAGTQPRHWMENSTYHPAKAWLVGQSVALREMSWQLQKENPPAASAAPRWEGLLWVLTQSPAISNLLPEIKSLPLETSTENLIKVHRVADKLARAVSEHAWDESLTRAILKDLSGTSASFRTNSGSPLQARRAERLVLALDRLYISLGTPNPETVQSLLDQLFASVQSIPDFAADEFASRLDAFARHFQTF